MSVGSVQFYARGGLRIEAADGSALQLNAENGDTATFVATVTQSGTITSFLPPWSESYRIRCFNAESNQPLTRFVCN